MPTIDVSGHTISYEEVGTGEPMLFLAYTRFDSATHWIPFMTEHAKGFRMIMPDALGMAKSTHVPMIEPAQWVSDLLALVDHLGLASTYIAAETLGSRVAVRFAADHPERVKGLVLNGSIAYSSPQGDAERSKSASPEHMPVERRELMARLHGDDWEAVNQFYQALHDREDFKSHYDLREVGLRVTSPALVMRGDIDEPIHPVEHSVALHKAIANSWLAIYPNTPFSALRAHPKEVWDLIRKFVTSHSA